MNWSRWAGKHLPFLLLVPAFILIATIAIAPSIYSVYLSFTKYNIWLNLEPVFSGLSQYTYLFTKDLFIDNTLLVTVEWVVMFIGIGYPLALILALLLNQQALRGRAFYRVALMVSYAVPITGIWPVWQKILDPGSGLLNRSLEAVGLMSSSNPVAWISNYPVLSVAMIAQWNGFAFGMLTILAALQSIPRQEYEAARLDGASRLSIFRYVEWPHLMPLNVVLWMLGLISTLNTFNALYVITGGGPGFASTTLYLYAFRYLLQGDYAYTAAIATVLFLVEMVIAVFYIRYLWLKNR